MTNKKEESNKTEEKNLGGLEPFYDDPIDMQNKIDEYFFDFFQGELQKRTPTTTGLALYLGFCSRQSLHDYKEKEEFSYVIKRAISHIEALAEEKCLDGSAGPGTIFWMKNHDWKDKQEIDNKTSVSLTVDSDDAEL